MEYEVTESTSALFVLYNLVFSAPAGIITVEGLCDDLKRLGKSLSPREIKVIKEGLCDDIRPFRLVSERAAIELQLSQWYREGRLNTRSGGYILA